MQTLNISKLSALGWSWRGPTGIATLLFLMVAILMGNKPAEQVAASSFHQWRTSQVVAAFKSAGLEVEIVRPGKKGDADGLSMFMAVEATRFRIPSAGENEGGVILSFYKADDLARMRNYYLALNKSLPQFSSWVFVKDNILLQINGSLPGPEARKYATALEAPESEKTLAIVMFQEDGWNRDGNSFEIKQYQPIQFFTVAGASLCVSGRQQLRNQAVSANPIFRGARHAFVPNAAARGRAGSSNLDALSTNERERATNLALHYAWVK